MNHSRVRSVLTFCRCSSVIISSRSSSSMRLCSSGTGRGSGSIRRRDCSAPIVSCQFFSSPDSSWLLLTSRPVLEEEGCNRCIVKFATIDGIANMFQRGTNVSWIKSAAWRPLIVRNVDDEYRVETSMALPLMAFSGTALKSLMLVVL